MSRILEESEALVGAAIEGRFVLEKVIGVGGLSTVFKARHRQADLDVAVKVLHSNYSNTEESIERFKREAVIINVLNHPNIVNLYSFGILQGSIDKADGGTLPIPEARPYLVLELLNGVDLDYVLERSRLSELQAYRAMLGVLDALEFAHEHNVIHRDIKPSNVMLSNFTDSLELLDSEQLSESVKLLDFGIAKCNKCHDKKPPNLTQPGEVFGSPLYMSPEQCKGIDLDHRSDIYSFGCMYYKILCGVPPFKGENATHTFAMHIYEEAETCRRGPFASLISEEIDEIVRKCLRKNPDERWNSVAEIKSALSTLYRN